MRNIPGKPAERRPDAVLSELRLSPHGAWRRGLTIARHWLAVIGGSLGLTLAPLFACSTLPGPRGISLVALEQAEAVEPARVERWRVADADLLAPVSTPLGPRMMLVELRSAADWRRFVDALGVSPTSPAAHAAESDLVAPDFSRGMVVGVVSRLGEPLADDWPVSVDSVRSHDGAGFLAVRFAPGNYRPDGAAFAETAFVEGLAAVLAVEINGDRFYPGHAR